MKKIPVLVLVLLSLLSCSNDLDVHVERGYLPVVYCMLDLNAEEQVVRVSRTFLSDVESSGKPPSADSLIIREPCEIYVEKWVGDDPMDTYLFSKTLLTKDTGLFPVLGQEFYVSDFKAEPLARYALYVYFPDLNKVVSGETVTTGFPVSEDPKPEIPREITITRDRGFTARWFTVAQGGVYQGIFRLNYLENSDEGISFHHIQWILPNVVEDASGELITLELNPNKFFELLVQGIPVNPDVTRELVGMDFTLIAGGEEVGLSLRTTDIKDFANSGEYTNLDNGIGIFSSIARTYVKNLMFSYLTEDAVCSDPELKSLNFRKGGSDE